MSVNPCKHGDREKDQNNNFVNASAHGGAGIDREGRARRAAARGATEDARTARSADLPAGSRAARDYYGQHHQQQHQHQAGQQTQRSGEGAVGGPGGPQVTAKVLWGNVSAIKELRDKEQSERQLGTRATGRRHHFLTLLLLTVLVLLHQCSRCAASEQTKTASSHAEELSPNATDQWMPVANNPAVEPHVELPKPIGFDRDDATESPEITPRRHKTRRKGQGSKTKKRKNAMQTALHSAARKGLAAMIELYDRQEPDMLKRGAVLEANDPGTLLAQFSASNQTEMDAKAAYASLVAAKKFKESTNVEYVALGRQVPPKISLKRTPLEKLCPSREAPRCVPASLRYRTHDGTCNNARRQRWGSAQMPFHRFLAPEYQDGVEDIRRSVTGATLPSARFVSLVVHGSRSEEAPVTMMLALWGQLIDHDMTATAQPRSLNGSTPRCCGGGEESTHPSCLPIKVPHDDPWLAHLGVRCLEFLRSAPAQRRDCLLSWREQTNQATSFLDASPIYSSNPRSSDNARIFQRGQLLFGRGPPHEDVCLRAALANQCIRPGDSRSGEQPGLLMMHTIWVNEHNQIATRLSDLNPHWSDEKVYQEARRIVGALFQHITYREFLPLVLGREVCRLFGLELETSGHFRGYDPAVNPTVANEFSAAAFRFGHSLVQGTYLRADRHHRFLANNVSLHEDAAEGDFGGPGSLHRLLRGMVNQRALRRDEFITAELTNHLFQTKSFPFGLDLAAINIQRGRDHGIPAYVNWRGPCGLSPVKDWTDLERIMGPASTNRLRKAYRTVDDVDLFVGGLAERPVVGGIVGPTFACIVAQQFSNLRRGDRFWYENGGFESSFTPAQLESIRQVALAQVLCRALGGAGTLQPFAFLPPDHAQNERLPCGSRLMAPIDLDPWRERDPFNNDAQDVDEDSDEDDGDDEDDNDSDTSDLDTAQSSTFSSPTVPSTTRRPPPANVINKVDLVTNGNTGLNTAPQPRPGLRPATLTVGPTVTVSDKLDLAPSTTARPNRPALAQTGSTVIDHKLDLKPTAKPTAKPTTKRKQTRRPTTTKRRPATLVVSNNLDFSRRTTNGTLKNTDRTRTRRELRGGYYNYQTATAPPTTDYYDNDNDADYSDDYDAPPPPYLAYGYHRPTVRPTTTTTSTTAYAYYGHYTAPPTPPPPPPLPNPYFNTRRPAAQRTTTARQRPSDQLTLDAPTDARRPTTNARPNSQAHRPLPPAAHTSVFSVDFKSLPPATDGEGRSLKGVVTNRQTFHSANTKLPSSSSSSSSSSFASASIASSLRSTSGLTVPSTGDLPTQLSQHASLSTYDYDDDDADGTDYDETRPDRPTHGRPHRRNHPSNATNDGDAAALALLEAHDGYLRPEQTHFEPLVGERETGQQTYRDYWTTLNGTRTKTYADQLDKSGSSRPLYYDRRKPFDIATRRYAPDHDGPLLLDDYSDKFVGLLLHGDDHGRQDGTRPDSTPPTHHGRTKDGRSIRTDTNRDGTALEAHKQTDKRTGKRPDNRPDKRPDNRPDKRQDKRPTNHQQRPMVPVRKQPAPISMVPFVLLTSIDRPDNWVRYHSKPSKRRKPPPAVPVLKSDAFSLSEFPTPIAEQD